MTVDVGRDGSGQFREMPVLNRFWSKVDKSTDGGCWVWRAATLLPPNMPYGRFWDGSREVKAHRFSYELHYGPIPTGLQVLHRCDNPPCVNPAHLFVGTHDDNMRDKLLKGRNCYGDRNGSRTHPQSRPRGESAPAALITDDAARSVYREYHAGGVTQTELARRLGVSQQLISNIVGARARYAWLA